MSQEPKIITVFGATGAQGGGLARAILTHPEAGFKLRAVTRNANSDKAKALADAGAEIVVADLDDSASLDAALAGSHGAFFITNFWEHFDPNKEIAQAKNLAEAANRASVHHVIWSTLEDTRRWVPLEDDRMPTLQGRFKCPHFDSKGESDAFFDKSHTTFLLTSFYWDNFIHFGMGPQPGPDGMLGITFPMGDAKLPGIAAEDIGKCAFGIFKGGDQYLGKTVGIAGGHPTGAEMAAGFTQATGKAVRYNEVPADVYRGFGFPGAEDLGNMFQFKRDFNDYFTGARSVEFSRSLNPELKSFDQWISENSKSF